MLTMRITTATTTGLQQPATSADKAQPSKSTLTALLPLPRSFFLSLTLPELTPATDAQIRSAITGSHLIELRVDLLSPDLHSDPARLHPFVTDQVHTLRSLAPLPILFTVRTESQGGSWPDHDVDGLLALYQLAISSHVEVLDVEMQLSDEKIEEVIRWAREEGGRTELLMSHHDWSGDISWDDLDSSSASSNAAIGPQHWQYWYSRGVRWGDAVKLVGTAQNSRDNIALENFRVRINSPDALQKSRPTARVDTLGRSRDTPQSATGEASTSRPAQKAPLCAVNMGVKGQMSRVLNDFLTPVTHEALGRVAAPGQLSVREIELAARLLGLGEGEAD